MCIYIHIYILCLYMCIYIYTVYLYVYLYIYTVYLYVYLYSIYIYIYIHVLWLVSCPHFSWFHPLFMSGWWLNWWRRDRLRPDKGWAQQQPHADTAQGGDEEVPESVGHKAALLGSQEKHGRSGMILSGYMYISLYDIYVHSNNIYIYVCVLYILYILYIYVLLYIIYIDHHIA